MTKDKIQHFCVSMAIAIEVIWLCLPLGKGVALCCCVLAVALAGIGKECYDCIKKDSTGFDLKDLFADLLGMIAGVIISLLLL